MNYVKTQFGNIHVNDIPVVIPETTNSKFTGAFMFFSVLVIIIVVFLYYYKWSPNLNKKEKIVIESFTDKVATVIMASAIDVYDTDIIYLENIVIITDDNNVININVLTNPNVITKSNGMMFTLDFKSELAIKEIILISDSEPDNYIKHINIDLSNDGSKVWEYSAFLPHLQENSVVVAQQVFKPVEVAMVPEVTQKIIMNESDMALTLTETDEEYVSY